MEGRLDPLESVAALLRDAGKNYPRSVRKKLAGTIVETRSRTEEGRSHEQPVKTYEVAVKGLLRIRRAVTISSKLPAERQDGRWCDEEVRYRITPVGTT